MWLFDVKLNQVAVSVLAYTLRWTKEIVTIRCPRFSFISRGDVVETQILDRIQTSPKNQSYRHCYVQLKSLGENP